MLKPVTRSLFCTLQLKAANHRHHCHSVFLLKGRHNNLRIMWLSVSWLGIHKKSETFAKNLQLIGGRWRCEVWTGSVCPNVSLPPLCNPIKGSTDIYPAAGLDACVCYAFFFFFLLKSLQIQIWGPLLFLSQGKDCFQWCNINKNNTNVAFSSSSKYT